jgi:hypothetical protein
MRAYPSLPAFPDPLPECQFDSLQNDVMDFAALLKGGSKGVAVVNRARPTV